VTGGSLRALLEGDPVTVAPQLLGMRVRTRFGGELTEVVLDEVEAYAGPGDPASHSANGPTPRNRPMWGPAGTLYVYRSYGLHWCMNVVTGPRGIPGAVLLRGGKPAGGEESMRRRRGRPDRLADGPGKLCAALGVTGDHNATSVLGGGPVRLLARRGPAPEYAATPRIGITRAADRPWRFVSVAGR
jgi:DNA-3-methyladenine glycosylase